jgi:hypothetical protein
MNTPISDDNKGARMLLQMGWRKGEGLGRNGTGILDPVKAESYAQNAGIGASSSRDVSNESYRNRTLEVVSLILVEKDLVCILFKRMIFFSKTQKTYKQPCEKGTKAIWS